MLPPPKMDHSHAALMCKDVGVHQGDALWILEGAELCWQKHGLGERLCCERNAMAAGCPEVGMDKS